MTRRGDLRNLKSLHNFVSSSTSIRNTTINTSDDQFRLIKYVYIREIVINGSF